MIGKTFRATALPKGIVRTCGVRALRVHQLKKGLQSLYYNFESEL